MSKTSIEWADVVWNPVTGCTKVSQGCKNCYAKRIHDMRHRAYRAGKKLPEQYAVPFETVVMHPERLDIPNGWRKPRRIFVNSMSDLFHESLINQPEWGDFIVQLWLTMLHNVDRHTFMILTKRPKIMEREVKLLVGSGFPVLPNVWLGVSVENQETAEERIPLLLETPAAVRFVSVEPILGPVNLTWWLEKCPECGQSPSLDPSWRWEGQNWAHHHGYPIGHIPTIPASDLDWIIAGCESGPNARPAYTNWFRSVRDQCQVAGVPFFLKQMQAPNGKLMKMPLLDGQEWKQFPEV